MDSNIKTIYLRFQGNETDANKLYECFSTCIQGQQNHHNLNCEKHLPQLHASREFKIPKIFHNNTTICSI